MIQEIKDNIGFITVSTLVVAGFAFGTYAFLDNAKKNENELKAKLIEVSEQIENKVRIDIKEQSSIELSDNFSIDLTAINLLDGKDRIGDGEKSLNLYSVSNENMSFKSTYNLTDEQLSALTKGGSQKQIITTLGEIFEQLELSHLETKDLYAMSLGLQEEKDFKSLTKILGAAHKSNNLIKKDYETTPDMFMPTFSTVDVKEVDGAFKATLTIEGLEYHGKTDPNLGFGFIVGNSVYQSTENAALGYAVGISAAYASGFKRNNVYARVDEITVDITQEQANMTEQELREYIVKGMLEKTIEFEKETVSYSSNLSKTTNKTYAKMMDQELER